MRKMAFFAVCIILVFSSMSWAATCPTLVPQSPIVGRDFDPISIAPGKEGLVYIAEYFDGTVSAYAKDGKILKTYKIKQPVSVATDSSGNIYIGHVSYRNTFYTGAVTVFDKDFNMIREIGSGWGEFSYPMDIVVANSKVYVADNRGDVVKIFNESDGSAIGYFGGSGLNPGNLTRPTAIAIDPLTGNVYVSDRKLQYDGYTTGSDPLIPKGGTASSYTYGLGAGVHVFSPEGVYLRSLPISYDDGKVIAGSVLMIAPSGVYVDSTGTVFVTDSSLRRMFVFDSSDAYSCAIPFGVSSLNPSFVVEGQDGRMFVMTKESVLVYATDDYVDMTVTPDAAEFSAQDCTANQNSSVVTVTNNGNGQLDWEATSDSPWITVTPASGSINGQGPVNVTLEVNPAGLAYGEHSGTVTFISQGDSKDVSVTLNSFAPPTLSVTGGPFTFDVLGDVIPASESMNITLTGDAAGPTWTATPNIAWLGVSPSAGPSGTLSVAQVSINSAGLEGLSQGSTSGTIIIGSSCQSIVPVPVTVTLNYIKGGTITVSTNNDGAGYNITGPDTGSLFTGTGKSLVVNPVDPGTYTIEFDGIEGFKAPASYSLEVVLGDTAAFTGQYLDLREDNQLIVSSDYDGTITVFGDRGENMGSFSVSPDKGVISATASGDLNADGVDDIIVAHDGGVITGYLTDGTQIADINFSAYGFKSDVVLAAADLDGDGRAEVLAAPGEDNGDSPDIRVFGYDGSKVFDTGIIFKPYVKPLGVMMASGDLDGDGIDEFITTRGGNSPAGRSIEVRVFRADTSGGPGEWKASEVVTFAGGTSYARLSVSAGDLNADALDEIVIASETQKGASETQITIYDASGKEQGSFAVSGTGLRVVAGDVDYDGSSEIVVTDGASNVRIYDGTGALESPGFLMLDGVGVSGAKISLGQVGK